MLSPKIKKALNLLGGKVVVFDGKDCYVIMRIEELEKVTEKIENLTKQKLLDRINSDIGFWKSFQEERRKKELDLHDLKECENVEEDEMEYIR